MWLKQSEMFFKKIIIDKNTVKLGYNELGYNKLPVITNKLFPFFSPKLMITTVTDPVITNSGYNEKIWPVPRCSL